MKQNIFPPKFMKQKEFNSCTHTINIEAKKIRTRIYGFRYQLLQKLIISSLSPILTYKVLKKLTFSYEGTWSWYWLLLLTPPQGAGMAVGLSRGQLDSGKAKEEGTGLAWWWWWKWCGWLWECWVPDCGGPDCCVAPPCRHPEWVCPRERCPEDGPLQGECWGQQEGNLGIATPPFSPDKLLLLSSDWGKRTHELKINTNMPVANVTVNY